MHKWVKFLVISLLAVFCNFNIAQARPMITDLSERKIDINAQFTGKELLLYGARVEAGDIVVVIRGPNDSYIVRKKEDIGGVWINTKSVNFNDVPQFYLVASSRPFSDIDANTIKHNLGIGYDTIELSGTANSASTEINEFQKALFTKLEDNGLLNPETINLPLLEGTLFRIRVPFPEKIVSGTYTAEIYSFNDGELRGMQSIPITVDKVGFEAFVHHAAHKYPALYGIAAILVAISLGWTAASLFRKV